MGLEKTTTNQRVLYSINKTVINVIINLFPRHKIHLLITLKNLVLNCIIFTMFFSSFLWFENDQTFLFIYYIFFPFWDEGWEGQFYVIFNNYFKNDVLGILFRMRTDCVPK
jgi:hypothetical protein